MPAVLPVTEMQRNGSALVDQAMETKEPIYLTRRGRAAVVLMDAEEFDRMAAFQNSVYQRELRAYDGIKRGHDQIAHGEFTHLDEVLEAIDARLGQ